ncbi:hypothetical protein [Pedobacter rhodius]|uniref:Uncharacterized protein n=1 Tax=Pedobacter rhodius TaxID=3004098 RepID=A0ABT4KUT9_9SPHI|nr:hypothetical protein [Pedobacter sp. SJ11]MCZ4222599.1 hypothetical protein [Pedobacter sp. SJ11]
MFIYHNTQSAYAKIICIPAQPADWNARFKGKSVTQKTSITKTLAQGILNHAFGEKQFAIYAFVQENNDKKTIQIDKNNNLIVFPVKIHIYKNVGAKWKPIAQRTVANRIAYQQLQYDVANASLYAKAI